ncbi:MAG TPA: hypothetical protein VFZ48_01190 [Candidatus Saccharimonadales bacterium]
MKTELDTLMQKKMDRRAFLKHVTVGFVALTGAAALIKTLTGVNAAPKQQANYGASAYGGTKAGNVKG